MAVTANQLYVRQDGMRASLPVAASTRIYEGTLVFESAGYADDDTGAGIKKFVGIAIEEKDNSAGSAGDLNVEIWKTGIFELTGSGFAQADVGEMAYATDNYTIASGPTASGVPIGEIVEYLSSSRVAVSIDTTQSGDRLVLSEEFSLGDFTDNTDATGFADFATQLPVGVLVLAVTYDVTVAFDGSSTSVIQTGVAGDLDDFVADTTISVQTTGTRGSVAQANDAAYIDTAVTPRVTITEDDDFTDYTEGTVVVSIHCLKLR